MSAAEAVLELMEIRGLRLVTDGRRLGYVPQADIPDELRLLLAEHKSEIIACLSGDGARTPNTTGNPQVLSPAGHLVDEITPENPDDEEPVECPQCGGIHCWWNGLGQRRCMACDPPSKVALRYLETFARMRAEGKCRAAASDVPARGLIGCGFPPVPVTEPPSEILSRKEANGD